MGISYFRSVWNAACFRQHFWKDCSWRREYFKTHAHAHRAHAHQLLVLTGVQQNKKIESINRQRARPVNLKVPTSHDSVMAKKDHAPHCQYFWFAEFTSTRCTQHTGKSSFKKQNKKNTTSYQIALHSVAQGKKKITILKHWTNPNAFRCLLSRLHWNCRQASRMLRWKCCAFQIKPPGQMGNFAVTLGMLQLPCKPSSWISMWHRGVNSRKRQDSTQELRRGPLTHTAFVLWEYDEPVHVSNVIYVKMRYSECLK